MRFSIAYYLLLLYTVVMFKPLVPAICNAWDHAFAEARHIASVHAKYGTHHLEKQLAATEENGNAKNEANIKSTDPAPAHYPVNIYAINAVEKLAENKHSLSFKHNLASAPSSIIVPPPDLL